MSDRIYQCNCGNQLVRVTRRTVITKFRVRGENFIECPKCKKHLPYPSWIRWRPKNIV